MSRFADRIARDYPVRHTEKEKAELRAYLLRELKEMGYTAKLQTRESPLARGGGSTNVVVGDVDRARIILTAHYDTPLRELLPPLIMPTRPMTSALYQALTPILAIAAALVISFAVTMPLNAPFWTMPLFLLLLVGMIAYLRFGPGEKNNLEQNDSGVAALLETAAALSPRWRGAAAFVFTDGMGGAKAVKKQYPSAAEKTVISLDCVGAGQEILFLPSRYSRWNTEALDAILESFDGVAGEGKSCFLKTDGIVYYPAGNRAFRYSIAVCACDKLAGFGRIVRPRRTKKIDEENLRILKEGLCRLIAAFGAE